MPVNSIIKTGLCLVAGSGLFVSAPAFAEDASTLNPAGKWKLSRYLDKCSLSRSFGQGEDTLRLMIEKGGPEPTFNLLLVGDRVSNPVGRVISVQFGPREEPYGRTFVAAKTADKDGVLMMYGASFTMSVPDKDGNYRVESLEPERLAAIEYLQIERAGLKPFRLPTGNLTMIIERVQACAQTLAGALRISTVGQSRDPEPITDRGRWFISEDYPALMLAYEREGEVTYRLTVGTDGQPTFCTIKQTNTPQMFDDAVCRALLNRARFAPALDWEGQPKPSYFLGTVRFNIR